MVKFTLRYLFSICFPFPVMGQTKNYYKILGVEKTATSAEIKKRYRELARKHHPDVNNGSKKSENNFKILSAAYQVLSDKKKRREYDQQTAYRKKSPPQRDRRGSWADPGADFNRGRRTEYREDFNRTTAQEEQKYDPDFPTRGFDLQFMLHLPLATVALGGTVPYSYEKYVHCLDCEGAGSDGSATCAACKGKRLVVRPVTLDVRIPPGVGDGFVLRIPDAGGAGKNGGPPGDLLVQVCMQKHPRFKRVRNDIYAEVSISPELAEKGGALEIETLDTVQTIQVDEGTLTGEELRIPGLGAAIHWGKKRGDFIVKFKIEDE